MHTENLISIIIPFHNCSELTFACLRSIRQFTNIDCEIILIDDASTENLDLASVLGGMSWKLIRNVVRKSFSENNNAAAAQALGNYLCLLNNDTLVTPNWLSTLLQVASQEHQLGALGNKHLYPSSNLLQHAGIAVTEDCEPLHLHPGTDPDLPAVNYQREVPAVTFACAMIPKRVYQELGGLDESYRNGYEDVDFCFRAAQAGYRILYTPASTIFHYGQSTPGRTVTDEQNRRIFRQRWSQTTPRDYVSITNMDRTFNRTRNRVSKPRRPGLHFALDCSRPTAFTWAGVELVMALQDIGVPVTLPPRQSVHASIPAGYAKRLRKLSSFEPNQTYHLKWSHYWPEHFRTPLIGEVNAELFCTNYNYPDATKPLDLWTRHLLLNDYRKLPVSEYNDKVLETLGVPAHRRRIVPLGYAPEIETLDPDVQRLKQPQRDELHVLLMTNSHDLFRYGTDLAITALARAFQPHDKVVVHIRDYGRGASRALEDLIAGHKHFPKVVWHTDFLPKRDLLRLYASMDVQLSPFRGEGFAMKILDAMALGVPCIMPLYGGPTEFATSSTCLPVKFTEENVGQCYDRENYYLGEGATWCAPDLDDLTRILVRLTSHRDELPLLGEAARTYVRGRFTWAQSAKTLMDALKGWQSLRLAHISRRTGPDRRDLSVVIPTKDRTDQLSKTLTGYLAQTVAPERYEILLINDHGDKGLLNQTVANFARLNISVIENDGPHGPGAARNLGIERAGGNIVLITGDDILPDNTFLEKHLEAHHRYPEETAAFVGNSPWHPELKPSPFLDYLTGKGGEQFKYEDMRDGGQVPFDRFYTSNVSAKRSFLAQQETLFSSHYRYAAYEDVELGYRLHLQGMNLRYLQDAIGLHHHPVSPESFLQRQYKVGRMLTVLALQQPSYVPLHHFSWLNLLEMLRCNQELQQRTKSNLPASNGLPEQLTSYFSGLLHLEEASRELLMPGIGESDLNHWADWVDKKSMNLWTAANQLILRRGMVDEWAGEHKELAERGNQWVEATLLSRMLSGQAPEWDVPLQMADHQAGRHNRHPFIGKFVVFFLKSPLLQSMYAHLNSSRAGRVFISRLRQKMGI